MQTSQNDSIMVSYSLVIPFFLILIHNNTFQLSLFGDCLTYKVENLEALGNAMAYARWSSPMHYYLYRLM